MAKVSLIKGLEFHLPTKEHLSVGLRSPGGADSFLSSFTLQQTAPVRTDDHGLRKPQNWSPDCTQAAP